MRTFVKVFAPIFLLSLLLAGWVISAAAQSQNDNLDETATAIVLRASQIAAVTQTAQQKLNDNPSFITATEIIRQATVRASINLTQTRIALSTLEPLYMTATYIVAQATQRASVDLTQTSFVFISPTATLSPTPVALVPVDQATSISATTAALPTSTPQPLFLPTFTPIPFDDAEDCDLCITATFIVQQATDEAALQFTLTALAGSSELGASDIYRTATALVPEATRQAATRNAPFAASATGIAATQQFFMQQTALAPTPTFPPTLTPLPVLLWLRDAEYREADQTLYVEFNTTEGYALVDAAIHDAAGNEVYSDTFVLSPGAENTTPTSIPEDFLANSTPTFENMNSSLALPLQGLNDGETYTLTLSLLDAGGKALGAPKNVQFTVEGDSAAPESRFEIDDVHWNESRDSLFVYIDSVLPEPVERVVLSIFDEQFGIPVLNGLFVRDSTDSLVLPIDPNMLHDHTHYRITAMPYGAGGALLDEPASFIFDAGSPAPIGIQIRQINYAAGLRDLSIDVAGVIPVDTTATISLQNGGRRYWTQNFNSSDIANGITAQLDPEQLVPQVVYTFVAQVFDVSNNSLMTPVMRDFFYDPPSVSVDQIIHTPGTRDVTLQLIAKYPENIPQTSIWVGRDYNQDKTALYSTIVDGAPESVTIDTSRLEPGANYQVIVVAVDSNDQWLNNSWIVNFTYDPPRIDYILLFVNRNTGAILIGVLVAIAVLFVISLPVRAYQRRWLEVTHTGALAILPFQRGRVVGRVKKRLALLDLRGFLAETTHMGGNIFRRLHTDLESLNATSGNRAAISDYIRLIDEIDRARPQLAGAPAKGFQLMLLNSMTAHLFKAAAPLADQYWNIEGVIETFRPIIPHEPETDDEIVAAVIETLQQLADAIDRLRAALSSDEKMLSPDDLAALNVLIQVRETVIQLTRQAFNSDLDGTVFALQDILSTLETARNNAKPQGIVMMRRGVGVIEAPDGMMQALSRAYDAVNFAAGLIKRRIQNVEEIITQILQNITTVEAMARVDESLNTITGGGFGQLTEDTIRNLLDIRQEVSAALAQQPESYGRRLAMLDAYLLIQQFQGQLKGSTLPRAKEWASLVATIAELFKERRQGEESQGMAYINPYVTGNPIKANRLMLFKGRQHIAQEIITRLRGSGNPTLLLYGPRRMGKSSFLLHLPNLLPARYIPVYFDAQGAGATQSEANFCYLLARAIYDVMRKGVESRRSMTPLQAAPSLADFKEQALTRLEDWLNDSVAPVLENRTLLITIDEFEKIGEAIREGKMTTALLDQIRHMIQHREELVFMFTGVQSLDALVPDAASYFISVVSIELGYLDHDAAEDLIRNPASEQEGSVPRYDDAAVAEILRLTHCQPFLIQAVCSEIITIANNEQISLIQAEHVQRAAQIAQTRQTNFFRNIWDEAGEDGREFLRSLVKNHATTDSSSSVIDDLLHRHVIRRVNGSFEVEVPLVREWMVKQG